MTETFSSEELLKGYGEYLRMADGGIEELIEIESEFKMDRQAGRLKPQQRRHSTIKYSKALEMHFRIKRMILRAAN